MILNFKGAKRAFKYAANFCKIDETAPEFCDFTATGLPSNARQTQPARRATPLQTALPLICVFICIYVIFVAESIAVWLAVWWDPHRMERQPALQDHFFELIRECDWLPRPSHKWMVAAGLVVGLRQRAVPFVSWWARVGTIWCILRTLRIVTFLLVVLPSPAPGCYIDRFEGTWEGRGWWHTMLMAKINGGCNDLLFSGHVTFTTHALLAIYYTPGYKKFALLLSPIWFMHALGVINDHKHYSVDVWLAVMITTMVWRIVYLEGCINASSVPIHTTWVCGISKSQSIERVVLPR